MPFRPWESAARTWRRASLRTQLVVMFAGLMVLTLAVTTFVSASLFRQELVRNLDEDLDANRQSVATFLTSRAAGEDPDLEYFSNEVSVWRFYGALLDNEGETVEDLAALAATQDQDLPDIPTLDADDVLARGSEGFDVAGTQEGSRGWRVRVYPLTSGEASVAIALPRDTVELAVERATFLVSTIGLMATLAASTLAYGVVTRSFRPLFRVEKTAASIADGDFSQRVQISSPADTEVGRLQRSLNVMLEHIEEAFRAKSASEENMRRFIQDASHELRTPLVTIRGFSELYRQGGVSDDPEAVGTAMGRIESEAKRMGQLVEDMLTLARLDEQRPLQLAPVDLRLLAHDASMDLSVNAPDREVEVVGLDDADPRPAPVLGDEGKIRQIVTNLMTNALRYTPAGTPIELMVGTESLLEGRTDSVLRVRDHGHGISEEAASRIFERFYRADDSRHRETGGTGLGLAIVAAIASQHGGTVRYSETEGGGATMTLRLPMVEPGDQDDHETEDFDEDLEECPESASADEHSPEAASPRQEAVQPPPQESPRDSDTPGDSTGR
ncbi:sensor histidine kinase [Nesterenkonia aerolata]|uniref:histidine kinase n=1 Tax=Nesterenkonia aerolata TaxID=3074079 RepID=A0ABU2DSZ5_9MICC|nr:HAMP domain-containing sensor histidine kinase [Nesterenkonia sp. LY-0111]MDR8019617.1 HAMP domain-containing sensor histidine kinase [Nesterenkonia sp. LY-0111]